MAAASLATASSAVAVAVVKRATRKAQEALELETDQARQALELEELAAQVEAAVKKFAAISPELVAAITAVGDKTVASNLAEALAPVALVQGVSVKQLLATLLPADSAIGQMLQSAFNAAQANVQKD
jgi:cell division septum initiation protein DivIVA